MHRCPVILTGVQMGEPSVVGVVTTACEHCEGAATKRHAGKAGEAQALAVPHGEAMSRPNLHFHSSLHFGNMDGFLHCLSLS